MVKKDIALLRKWRPCNPPNKDLAWKLFEASKLAHWLNKVEKAEKYGEEALQQFTWLRYPKVVASTKSLLQEINKVIQQKKIMGKMMKN
jgi:hypothetical protein